MAVKRPIDRIRQYAQLADLIPDKPLSALVRRLDAEQKSILLSTPFALAYGLARLAPPDLLTRPSIRVLLYSHEVIDATDEGRWLQLAALLLGYTGRLEVDVVINGPWGPEAATAYGPRLQYLAPARVQFGRLADRLVHGPAADLVFACRPGLHYNPGEETHLDWLPRLMEDGVPVIGDVTSQLDGELFSRVGEGSGQCTTTLIEVPAYGVLQEPGEPCTFLARYLYRFDAAPMRLEQPDKKVMRRIMDVADDLDIARQQGTLSQWAGTVAVTPAFPDGVAVGVDERCVAVGSHRRLVLLNRTGEAPRFREIEPADARYTPIPTEAAPAMGALDVCLAVQDAHAQYLLEDDADLETELRDEVLDQIGLDDAERAVLRRFRAMSKQPSGMDAGLPLFLAASADDAEAVRTAVAAGEPINAYDGNGFTPLHEAARANAPRAVRALIEAGADLELPHAVDGSTAAVVALTRGHEGVLLALLEAGASPDASTLDGRTPRRAILSGRLGPALVAWYQTAVAAGRIGEEPTGLPVDRTGLHQLDPVDPELLPEVLDDAFDLSDASGFPVHVAFALDADARHGMCGIIAAGARGDGTLEYITFCRRPYLRQASAALAHAIRNGRYQPLSTPEAFDDLRAESLRVIGYILDPLHDSSDMVAIFQEGLGMPVPIFLEVVQPGARPALPTICDVDALVAPTAGDLDQRIRAFIARRR